MSLYPPFIARLNFIATPKLPLVLTVALATDDLFPLVPSNGEPFSLVWSITDLRTMQETQWVYGVDGEIANNASGSGIYQLSIPGGVIQPDTCYSWMIAWGKTEDYTEPLSLAAMGHIYVREA